MQELSIGVQDFEMLRREHLLYVDKTAQLLQLVQSGRRYFLARPRRFGKSLTLSTLEAMFSGKFELFKGLLAEEWVREQHQNPYPVLRLDMSSLESPVDAAMLNESINSELRSIAEEHGLEIKDAMRCGETLKNVIRSMARKRGYIVVLIDEYDKSILDNISNLKKAEEMRLVLKSFYTVLKSCDKYLRFVLLTGITKFSKVGVFSALNNLEDISLDEEYGALLGYTQQELECYFGDSIRKFAEKLKISLEELIKRLQNYYASASFASTFTAFQTWLYTTLWAWHTVAKR